MIGQLSKSPTFQVLMGGWAILLLLGQLWAEETSPSSRSATSPNILLPPEIRLAALPARAPEPADNVSTPDKIALGRLLFFDPIFSCNLDYRHLTPALKPALFPFA